MNTLENDQKGDDVTSWSVLGAPGGDLALISTTIMRDEKPQNKILTFLECIERDVQLVRGYFIDFFQEPFFRGVHMHIHLTRRGV